MNLVHLADLHLGFRQHERQAPNGLNQRESDVADAFTRAVDTTIALAPDVVLIAGDVFHAVRPSNPAICLAVQQFTRLRRALPDAVVVMVAGNHDTPRAAETGCMLRLFPSMGILVADLAARRFDIPSRDLSILAVPEGVRERPSFTPNPAVGTNILLTHLAVTDVCPVSEHAAGLSASIEEMGPERWQYIAVGHYHVYRELAANASYAGSIEYTSSDPWGEMREQAARGVPGKGLVAFDTVTGVRTFHPIAAPRRFVDLPVIDATGMIPGELDRAIHDRADAGDIDGAVVRQVIRNCPAGAKQGLDYKALRALMKRAAHYHLDARKQERGARIGGVSERPRRLSLDEMLRNLLADRQLPADVDRGRLVAVGLDYLDEAAAQESRRSGDPLIGADTIEGTTPHTWATQPVDGFDAPMDVCTECGQVRHQFDHVNGGCPGAASAQAA